MNHSPCSQINSNGAGGGDINVTAYSPTNRPLMCPVKEEDGVYAATFQPDEAGEWSIAVRYDEEHIQGSPFTCHVYDPNAIRVTDWLTLFSWVSFSPLLYIGFPTKILSKTYSQSEMNTGQCKTFQSRATAPLSFPPVTTPY